MQVVITAILKDPVGVWEDMARVECQDGTPVNAIILQILGALRNNGGLVSFTDAGATAEFIPMDRVKNITLRASTVSVIAGGDAAIRQAAAQAQAKLNQIKKLHV